MDLHGEKVASIGGVVRGGRSRRAQLLCTRLGCCWRRRRCASPGSGLVQCGWILASTTWTSGSTCLEWGGCVRPDIARSVMTPWAPRGPTLFETGMDLSDTTLGSGGEDQVRARGVVHQEFHGGLSSGETRCSPGVGTAFRAGDVLSSKMTALWHQLSAIERCSHAESTFPTGTGSAGRRPSLGVRCAWGRLSA